MQHNVVMQPGQPDPPATGPELPAQGSAKPGATELADVTLADVTETAPQPAPPVDGLVAVVGLGYVGLPTAVGFHEAGSRVIGLDISETRLETIRSGKADLLLADQLRLTRAMHGSRLTLTADAALLPSADAVVICVPTPVDEHLTPDLGPLRRACAAVVAGARAGQLLLLTSTAFVGATRQLLVEPLRERGLIAGEDVNVAFSPERIDPGRPDHLPEHTTRVVGGVTRTCTRRATAVLTRLTEAGVHAVRSPELAEMVKLHENAFRAVNLALANEMAELCRAFDLDPAEVVDAAATKPYGYLPHLPGPGVGGHCIPCDPHYLLWQLRRRRMFAPIIEQAMTAIAARPGKVAARVVESLAEAGRGIRGAKVIIVGVAYKPGVADLRSSSAVEILQYLLDKGADVHYWDPLVPALSLTGRVLECVPEPRGEDYDLALVHTLHPSAAHEWVAGCPRILDGTYRYLEAPHRELL